MIKENKLTKNEDNFYLNIVKADLIKNKINFDKMLKKIEENSYLLLGQYEDKLKEFCSIYGFDFPEEVIIKIIFGGVSYYNTFTIPFEIIIGINSPIEKSSIHEFVHLCIEKDLIEKYNVTKMVKEGIVDAICDKYLEVENYKVHRRGLFTYDKLTKDIIENGNLKIVVKNIVEEYNKINKQKQKGVVNEKYEI